MRGGRIRGGDGQKRRWKKKNTKEIRRTNGGEGGIGQIDKG